MSTRSAVIVKVGKKYKGIYCHWDGDSLLPALQTHSKTQKTAEALVALGSCSQICNTVRQKPIGPHTFDKPEEGTVLAYHRDRNEPWENCYPLEGSTWREVANEIDVHYIYVFNGKVWKLNKV